MNERLPRLIPLAKEAGWGRNGNYTEIRTHDGHLSSEWDEDRRWWRAIVDALA